MRRLGPILIATVAILTAGADAQVHDPPLFAAFKAFCIDTGASPDAVKSAVEAAGGQQAPPIHNRPEENSNHCTVNSFVNEDASIEAIRNWVGVPPAYISRGNPILYIFHYQELGSPIVGIVTPHYRAVRSTLPADKIAYDKAKAEGRTWALDVLQAQDGASVQLVHYLAPRGS